VVVGSENARERRIGIFIADEETTVNTLTMLRVAAVVATLAYCSTYTSRGFADNPPSAPAPVDVVNHHIRAYANKDIEAVLQDYADDAVMVMPNGICAGKRELRKGFEAFLAMQTPSTKMTMKVASIHGDVVVEDWSLDGGGTSTIKGSDVFVVRHGKIVFHALKP